MRIDLEEIDPRVREALSEPLLQRWEAISAPIRKGIVALTVAWLIGVPILAPIFIGILAEFRVPPSVWPLLWLGGAAVPGLYYGRQLPSARPLALRQVTAQRLHEAAASASLSRAERAYVEALGALVPAAEGIGEETARDLLRQLNRSRGSTNRRAR